MLDLKEVITDIIAREYPSAQIKDMHYVNRTINYNVSFIQPSFNQFWFGYLSLFASSTGDGEQSSAYINSLEFKDSICTNISLLLTSNSTSTHNLSLSIPTTPIIFNYAEPSEGSFNLIFIGLLVELSDLTTSSQ